jgi:hypothetical protein
LATYPFLDATSAEGMLTDRSLSKKTYTVPIILLFEQGSYNSGVIENYYKKKNKLRGP